MAPEGNGNIPLEIRSLPAGESPPYFRHHGHLKQATAARAYQTGRRQDLSQQEYRHSNLVTIRRMLQQSGSTVGIIPII
jgi:hypothetical protein